MSDLLKDALMTLDPIFTEHGEYNILFILNSYYENKYSDAIHTAKYSHLDWCASMLGQPFGTPECDCSSSRRRIAEIEVN